MITGTFLAEQPSLWDSVSMLIGPGAEAPGYWQMFLGNMFLSFPFAVVPTIGKCFRISRAVARIIGKCSSATILGDQKLGQTHSRISASVSVWSDALARR